MTAEEVARLVHSLLTVLPEAGGALLLLGSVSTVRRWRLRARTRSRAADVLAAGESPAASERSRRGGPAGRAAATEWGVAASTFCTVVLVAGVLPGVVPGIAAAGAARYLLRRERVRAAELAQARRAAAELPAAADLLAACLASGACPRRAAEAVGDSLPGPVGERLRTVAAELRLGAEPATAWTRLGSLPGATALARCLERATVTGAPAGEAVARAAESLREESRRGALARSQRAGVLITAPLAVCFLPAFLTVGVVPVLVGLAGQLMATG